MRATLLPDPHRGPGYSVIEIFGAPPLASPVFLLRRASDGAWLSGSGWGPEETSLTPGGWDSGPDTIDSGNGCQRLLLGPGVVDNLDPGDAYTLTIPGAGSCALMLGGVDQSHIIGGEAVGVTPPPVPGFTPDAPGWSPASPESAVNEGVEPTPEVLGGDDADLTPGVVAAPASEAEPTGKKRPGCALMGLIIFVGLFGAGTIFWHGAMCTSDATQAVTKRNGSAVTSAFALCPRKAPDSEAAFREEKMPKS